MLRSILKYCFSALLLLTVAHVMAQQEPPQEDTVQTQPKVKERLDYRPTGLRVGTDLIQDIKGFRSATFNGWEVNADVDFARYYFTLDYGTWAQSETLNNGLYQNDGRYWRVGADVNFLKRDPDKNMFFLGLRYAHSSFTDQAEFTFTDPTYGDLQQTLSNSNLKASWIEVTTGLRVKIWRFFWMGYTARIKLFPSLHGVGELQPYDIPGYGRAAAKNWWGFNYQLFIRIPWRKEIKNAATLKK